jgi:hypothetical protein
MVRLEALLRPMSTFLHVEPDPYLLDIAGLSCLVQLVGRISHEEGRQVHLVGCSLSQGSRPTSRLWGTCSTPTPSPAKNVRHIFCRGQ